ncbi:MAG: hypothetical protein KDK45_13070, partial [Leptospiraceae bacterium]|nr:hypothetical protein [Leptospiraceae bacterium]
SLLAIAVNNVSVKTDWTSGSSLTSTELNNIGNGINVVKAAIEGIPNWTKGTITTDAVYTEGNVGIGTDTPTTKLDVNGNINWSVPWTDFTTSTFATNVTHYSTNPASWQKCQYRKIGDIVYLRGLATKTSGFAANDLILTLPSGFRPPSPIAFSSVVHWVTPPSARVDVSSNGEVRVTSAATHVNLDGIIFSTN